MTVGERIKYHRKRCNMTQSQLAENLNVSVQAISKWETNAGLPDISQIVPLARVLNITTDELLAHGNRREDFERLWKETLQNFGDDPERLLEVSKSALEVFPRDVTFLYRRAVDEDRISEIPYNEHRRSYLLGQAIRHAQKALEEDPEFESAKQLIARVHAKMGNIDAAKAAAYKCKNVDIALKSCLEGEELRQHRQKLIDKQLCELLRELTWHDLPSLDAAERIIHAAIRDENLLYYYDTLMMISVRRAEYFINARDPDKAINALEKAFEYAKNGDALPKGIEFGFSEPLLDRLKYKRDPDFPSLAEQLLSFMNQPTLSCKESFSALKRKAIAAFLKQQGVILTAGLSEDDFQKIEALYGITFPKALRAFLSEFLPLSSDGENGFPNWSDFSEDNITNIKERIDNPQKLILEDIKYGFWNYEWGEKPENSDDALKIASNFIKTVPKMIPIYSHRYMPVVKGVDDPPIFSTVGRDTIVCGNDLFGYLLREFSDFKPTIESIDHDEIPFWGMLAK